MAENPWNKNAPAEGEPTHDEKIAELGEALLSTEDPEDEARAEAVEDDGDETEDTDSELFEAEEKADPDEEEVADPETEPVDEALFDDDESDEPAIPKGWTKGTYKRFNKVIGQRNELREEVEKINGRLAKAESLAGVLNEKYAEFTDPVAQATRDIQFMDALETLAKQDAGVNQFAAKIVDFIQTGRFNVPDATNPQATPAIIKTPEAPAEPQRDERVDRIVRRDAQREVSTTLESLGVKPSFQKLIGESILGDGDLDLTTVDRQLVIARSKAFIKENGFSADEVLAGKPGETKRTAKPNTGGGQGGPATGPKRSAKPKDQSSTPAAEETGTPKTLDEWEKRREERFRALAGD